MRVKHVYGLNILIGSNHSRYLKGCGSIQFLSSGPDQPYHLAKRCSVNLRSWLLEFLMYDGSVEAVYLYHLVIDLDGLFELLEVIQKEWKVREWSKKVVDE